MKEELEQAMQDYAALLAGKAEFIKQYKKDRSEWCQKINKQRGVRDKLRAKIKRATKV